MNLFSVSTAGTNPPAAAPVAPWSPPSTLLEVASGDDELMAEVIDTFGTDTEARVQRMRQALVESNLKALRSEAHTVKGSAGQVGAEALAEVCRELELTPNLSNAYLTELVGNIHQRFAEIRAAMIVYSHGLRI